MNLFIRRLLYHRRLISYGVQLLCVASVLKRLKSGSPSSLAADFTTLDGALSQNNGTLSQATHQACQSSGELWKPLCEAGFLDQASAILKQNGTILSLLQIGAHTGWDAKDPFVAGMTSYLESLPPTLRKRVHYTLVEASPVNYPVLQQKVKDHAHLCTIETIHAGVIPDTATPGNLTFYSISKDINVDTGLDLRTGVYLPPWVTQISSFSKKHVMYHWRGWSQYDLRIEDYVVESPVSTMRFSDLIPDQPFFVLLDTEGYDCHILRALTPSSALPPFLVYENKHCGPNKAQKTREHLSNLGYTTHKIGNQDTLAYRAYN